MFELVQVSENCYYIQSPAKIGLVKLNEEYVRLIADELIRDELDAAPIPKVLPEDLFEDLPEID